jgi:CheY-like chemotaxis protein
MKILVAEDEPAISMQYQVVLEERGHSVTLTDNGEDCLNLYMDALSSCIGDNSEKMHHPTPFDLVVLDYRMPKKNGLDAAKAILDACPHQRIMLASAYTQQTLVDGIKCLHKIVELLQKPFDLEYFVDAVEDKALYEQLERLNVRVRALRDYNVTHEQLVGLVSGIQKLQNVILHD